MTLAFRMPDTKWIEIGNKLRAAASDATQKIAAIPESVALDEEVRLVDEFSAPAYAVASQIAAMEPRTALAAEIQAMALSWLDGKGC